ncbi:probable transcriptional regulatory protein DICTH_1505 [Folsomia candida]|uniref:probable transcriptional regulatory protein DICTH_1505 n=1 Tax=Folsomia candida TaxID=158441 RepID=UPI000B8F231F|nr:probable transcriptional regulatory protein DICTH_1505 [Folsomia candida]
MNLFGEIGHLITKIVRRTGTPTSSPALLENLFNSGRSLVSCPQYFYQPSRNAGHSKWANIKHTKMAKDMEKSSLTVRFVNMIKIAIREGGGSTDPKLNSKLAQVISQIKDKKLPMAPYEKTLEREANRTNEKRQTLVFRGPGNCAVLADISSDSLNKTKQEINTILRKNRAVIGEDSILHLFLHKGIILCNELNGKPAHPDNLDEVIEDAIKAEADDVTFQTGHPDFGEVYEFSTSPDIFFKVKHALEKLNYTVVYGDIDYVPINPIELDETVIQDVHKLYQKLSDHPNVVKVTTNLA